MLGQAAWHDTLAALGVELFAQRGELLEAGIAVAREDGADAGLLRALQVFAPELRQPHALDFDDRVVLEWAVALELALEVVADGIERDRVGHDCRLRVPNDARR